MICFNNFNDKSRHFSVGSPIRVNTGGNNVNFKKSIFKPVFVLPILLLLHFFLLLSLCFHGKSSNNFVNPFLREFRSFTSYKRLISRWNWIRSVEELALVLAMVLGLVPVLVDAILISISYIYIIQIKSI